MNAAKGKKVLKMLGNGRFLNFAFAVLIMAVLSGCATCGPKGDCKVKYSFNPPAGPQGEICIMRCQRARSECMDDKELQYKNCEHHNRMSSLEFERCIASGATNCYNPSAAPCEKPCVDGPCGNTCETEFQHCYKSCGGTITSEEICTGGCE